MLLVALLLAPGAVSAQTSAPWVNMMDMKVDPADIPAWIEYHQQSAVPILEALVEDGALQAFDLWVHDTGGEHSTRYTYVLPNFNAVAEAGGRYMQRMAPADAAAFGAVMSTVRETTDGIWYIGDSSIPDDRPEAPYVYESAFQIEPSGQEQWKTDFASYSRPGLEQAMQEGLITAWARLDHSIGGPWNSKTVLWMTSLGRD